MSFLLKIATFAIVLSVAGSVDIDLPKLARHDEPLSVYPKEEQERSLFSELGVIKSLRQCGGSGRLLQWRNEACTWETVPGAACIFPASRDYRGELTFVPAEDSDSLGIRTVVKDSVSGGVLSAWEFDNLENSAVEAGKKFSIGGKVNLLPELRGKMITTQLSVIRESDKEVQVCAEADLLVV